MSLSSGPFIRERNASTWVHSGFVPRPKEASAEAAFAVAVAAERARLPLEGPGHRVYWMGSGAMGSLELHATRSDHAIVGRHTACDVVLADDPGISLRHVLLRSVVLDDGCPLVSVLDLHTSDGFRLAGAPVGASPRSVTSTDALVFHVGAYVLVALPSGTRLPETVPTPVVRSGHPYRDGAGAGHPGRTPISRVTLVRPIVDFAERPFRESVHGSPDDLEITLVAPVGTARARVSSADLDAGVLIGRDPRCIDRGMRALLDMTISRVHLLLLSGPRGLFAYDTASTLGVWSQRCPVRSLSLSSIGNDLWLGRAGVRVLV